MKNRIMRSLCLAHYSLRLDWCAYICLISGMLWGTCLRGHIGESVLMFMFVGHTDRTFFRICWAYRQEDFSCLWGIPTGRALVFVGHTDRKFSCVCGAYQQEVFSCLWGIPTGSALAFVGPTDRKSSRVCGTYRQEVLS